VRTLRFLGLLLYVGYLVHVGMLMLVIPWSEAWPSLMLHLPARVVPFLDAPFTRGAISAFGLLHLLLVLAEMVLPQSMKRLL